MVSNDISIIISLINVKEEISENIIVAYILKPTKLYKQLPQIAQLIFSITYYLEQKYQ